MEVGNSMFELSEHDLIDLARLKATLAKRSSSEILRPESSTVEQVPTPLPMSFRLIGHRFLGDEHEIFDQRPPYALRHPDQQVDVVRADDDHRGREQLVAVGHGLAQLAPIVPIDFGKIGFAANRGTLMNANIIGDRDSIRKEGGNGRGVKPLDVIALQESIDEQLPVRRDVMRAPFVEVEVA